jgi:choline-phosphate cytidylyltransferase
MSEKQTRIYIDGIFDVFHRGHLDVLRKAKEFRKNSTLIVGIISDKVAEEYKRKPIYNEEDRYLIINSIKYVDEVVFNSPLVLTKDFIEKHKIDIVLHSFSDINDFEKQKIYTEQIDNIFHLIPYNSHISTTSLINKIKTMNDK